jgi:PadR family transcriptional regulator, regulatory protein PadR
MYICPMYSSELVKGTLKTIVLKLLKEQGKMYGYEITQRVKELTLDKIQITEGALYPLLHALEAQGDLETEIEFIGKRQRKYYRLTTQGKQTSKKKITELQEFIETLRILLDANKGTSHGLTI